MSGAIIYTYVNGNPVNYTDPTGLIAGVDDAAVIIGGGAIIIGGCIATNCGDGMTSAAKAAAQAASSAVQAVKEFCENKKDDECEKQREREEMMCELLAGPRYWRGSKQAVAICKKAAFVRYSECLRGIPESERSPLTGVDTPI